MSFGPIGYALRIHFQLTSDPPQVHTIYIKLNRLLTNLRAVTAGFLYRRIFAAAQIASIPLTARCGFPNLVLLVCTLTSWTFHKPILPIKLGTPQHLTDGHDVEMLDSDVFLFWFRG